MAEEKVKKQSTNLKSLYSRLVKDYGKDTVVSGSSIKQGFMSTGRIMLDRAIGGKYPGIPNNKIIEIFGPQAGGKTTLTLSMIAEVQKSGGTALFLDLEHAFNPDFASKIGVQLDDESCMVVHVPSGNIAINIAGDALDNKIETGVGPDIIVIDSVSSLIPDRIANRALGDDDIGSIAKLMSNVLPQLADKAYRAEVPVIFINQIRNKKVSNPKANPETTSGGLSLGFYASLIMRVSKLGKHIEVDGAKLGHRVNVSILKNKVGIPFKCAEFNLRYDKGVDKYAEIAEVAVDQGIIRRGGAWYTYEKIDTSTGAVDEVFKIQGIDNVVSHLIANPKLYQEVSDSLTVMEAQEEDVV